MYTVDHWERIPGRWRHDYYINKLGLVYNGAKDKFLCPVYNGYLNVTLQLPDKRFKPVTLHVIVAKLFVPNPDNKPFVNHKDGIKFNPFAENLEWVTHQENINDAIVKGQIKTRFPVSIYLAGLQVGEECIIPHSHYGNINARINELRKSHQINHAIVSRLPSETVVKRIK
jgi:hypothetical protein